MLTLQADSLPTELPGKPKNPLNVLCSGAPQFVFKISILNCYVKIGLWWWWVGKSYNRKNMKDSAVVEMKRKAMIKPKQTQWLWRWLTVGDSEMHFEGRSTVGFAARCARQERKVDQGWSQASEQCTIALHTEMGKWRAGERQEAQLKCFGQRATENSILNFIKFPISSRLEHIQVEMLNKQLDMSLELK